MEHLPKPDWQTASIFPPIIYRCQERYDGGPFLDYPQRLKLPSLHISNGGSLTPVLSTNGENFLVDSSTATAEAFFQNWLFFGLLSEVLGNRFVHDEFVNRIQDDGTTVRMVVTTTKLISRLEEWIAEAENDKGSQKDTYDRVVACLRLVFACLTIEIPNFDIDLKVHLASVAEVVGYAARKACDVNWNDDHDRTSIPKIWSLVIDKRFWRTLLLERSNCCPSMMRMLSDDFVGPQALAFVASCFYNDDTQMDHSRCNDALCQASDVGNHDKSLRDGGENESKIVKNRRQLPRHASDTCECKDIHVDESLLAKPLRKGCLPLLRLKRLTDVDEMSIEVVESTDTTSYIALSHVWADGLGNPSANALPSCQLARLKNLIDDLKVQEMIDCKNPEITSEVLLWCDTLCCPINDQKTKKVALEQMYRTYDEASAVLVLDRDMISHRGGMGVDEVCLRIATSRWMTRLWTLQEGALPARRERLWFQFSEAAIWGDSLYNQLVKAKESDIGRRGIVSSVLRRLLTFKEVFHRTGVYLENVIVGLEYRSVTVPSDEPIIIATLLGLDLRPVLGKEDVTERMTELWWMIGHAPSGIDKQILFDTGPKMKQPGLRWAPQSLLSLGRHLLMPKAGEEEERGRLIQRESGLNVHLAGFRIRTGNGNFAGLNSTSGKFDHQNTIWMRANQGRWYSLRCDERKCPNESKTIIATITETCNPWILYQGSSPLASEHEEAEYGLLVDKASGQRLDKEPRAYVEIKSHVFFKTVHPETNKIVEAAYHLAQHLSASAAACHIEDLNGTDSRDPIFQEAFDDLDLEAERLARSDFALTAIAASGANPDERQFTIIRGFMEIFHEGLCVQIEEYVPNNTKWCVD